MTRRRATSITGLTAWLAPMLAVVALVAGACSSPTVEVGDPCSTTSDCAPDRALVCQNGFCFKQSCQSIEECPDGLSCVDQLCRSPECSGDSQCEEDALCLGSTCVEDGCRSKSDCETGQVCRGEPSTCRPPPDICADDGDCPVGRSCWPPEGECRDDCDAQADCGSGQYCGEQGQCRPNCTRDDDCLADETCSGGRCEPLPDCSTREPCSGQARYRNPLTCDCVECLQDNQCDVAVGEACTPSNSCLFCQLTTSSADCEARGLLEQAGCCVECQSDSDCGSATPFCNNGRCATLAPNECISDNECGTDQVCDRGQCAPAASFSACQVQSDCPDQEACFPDDRCHAASGACGGCRDGTRCVEDATVSLCAGCQTHCSTDSCRDGRICVVPDGEAEGFCLDQALAAQCS